MCKNCEELQKRVDELNGRISIELERNRQLQALVEFMEAGVGKADTRKPPTNDIRALRAFLNDKIEG